VTLASCNFVVISSGSDSAGVGLFSAEIGNGGCETFDPDAELNAAHQVGRAFGILTNLLLVFAFVGTFLMIFVLKEKAARMIWTTARILFVLALLSVLITFAGVANEVCVDDFFDVECTIGAAGICNAINACILIGIVSTAFCTPIPDEPVIKCGSPRKNNQNFPASPNTIVEEPAAAAPPKTTKTIEMTPHGRKITEVVEHPDGRKTATETYEETDDLQSYDPDPSTVVAVAIVDSGNDTQSWNGLPSFKDQARTVCPEVQAKQEEVLPTANARSTIDP